MMQRDPKQIDHYCGIDARELQGNELPCLSIIKDILS
jgi:hypothetical protein